jgi:hypothetical protein
MAEEYAQNAFDSCKEVQYPAINGLALDMLCGPWGSALCTPLR